MELLPTRSGTPPQKRWERCFNPAVRAGKKGFSPRKPQFSKQTRLPFLMCSEKFGLYYIPQAVTTKAA